ncbi:MAG: hypothetical protein NT031_09410 [Planctomycetota bacterium]|nr:hypothetical protein [Planctomycetota bacterium]
MRWLTPIAFAAWLAACGVLCGSAWGQSTQPASAPRPEILELVAQLGDKRWAVREAAHQKLQALRDPEIVPALQQGASSSDLETALSAKSLLAELLDFSHVVLDALGEPIPDATIVLTAPDPGAARLMPSLTLTANMFGGVALPPLWNRPQCMVRFHHKLYGLAQGYEPYRPVRPETPGQLVPPTPIVVPMVAQGSPAYAQSLRGQVVGPDGKGLAGAEVSCQNVRSPNGESFSSYDALPAVLTNEDGRFAFYPPANSRAQKGRRLVPPGSRYFVSIRARSFFRMPASTTTPPRRSSAWPAPSDFTASSSRPSTAGESAAKPPTTSPSSTARPPAGA